MVLLIRPAGSEVVHARRAGLRSNTDASTRSHAYRSQPSDTDSDETEQDPETWAANYEETTDKAGNLGEIYEDDSDPDSEDENDDANRDNSFQDNSFEAEEMNEEPVAIGNQDVAEPMPEQDYYAGSSFLGLDAASDVSGDLLLKTTSRVIDAEISRLQQTIRDIELADQTLQKIRTLNQAVQRYANEILQQDRPRVTENLMSAQALMATEGSMRKGFEAVRFLYKKIKQDQVRVLRSEIAAEKVFQKWERVEPDIAGGVL